MLLLQELFELFLADLRNVLAETMYCCRALAVDVYILATYCAAVFGGDLDSLALHSVRL